ncbi:MAG: cupin domain-containing protein [Chlorobi bacterium]|nr:cupin domain-containing protein [Chlorobiota bacterium]
MRKTEEWIERLRLQPHPEGGFYRETYRSPGTYGFGPDSPFGGPRSHATAIFYLLKTGERSRLHRIHSDELWFYHAGNPLRVHFFPSEGDPSSFLLGPDPDKDEVLQEAVPAESWFGACHDAGTSGTEGYSLVSCVVAPGFDFRDFTFAPKEVLRERYPACSSLIDRLA